MLESNGWDRHPRRPNTVLPAGSWDCAVHIYGPEGSCRLDPGRTYEAPDATLSDMLNVHQVLGIQYGIIIQPTIYGSDHTVMLEALAQLSGRYLGVALIDESTTDAELESLNAQGVCGARFNFLSSLKLDWNRRKFEHCVARIAELGWVTLVHGSAQELLDREEMLRRVPTPVVVDHMAHWDIANDSLSSDRFDSLVKLLSQENFWIKMSNGDRHSLLGNPFDDVVELGSKLVRAVPDRCIWASDWPHILYRGKAPNDAVLVDLAQRYTDDDVGLLRMFKENPERLFGRFLHR